MSNYILQTIGDRMFGGKQKNSSKTGQDQKTVISAYV